ncbi:MAG: DUF3450 domain-containing protein [Pseudomonadota bacterium]|mgnify:CR=1 FL=1
MSLYISNGKRSPALVVASAVLALALPATQSVHAQQAVKRVITEQVGFDRNSKQSQERVTRYAQQTSELLGEYRITLQQLDRTRVYNDNLSAVVNDQNQEITNIQQQLEDFGNTEQGIVPLMLDMIADLKAFIALDMPFQVEERELRIANLESNMTDSSISVSEKYRQIMEAYKIEAGFGRTIEAYTGSVMIDGADTQVEFLRVGRVVLAYQTADQSVTGLYNKQTKQWEVVGSEYRRAVSDGLALAKKQAPPQLLVLPVPGAGAAQ